MVFSFTPLCNTAIINMRPLWCGLFGTAFLVSGLYGPLPSQSYSPDLVVRKGPGLPRYVDIPTSSICAQAINHLGSPYICPQMYFHKNSNIKNYYCTEFQ